MHSSWALVQTRIHPPTGKSTRHHTSIAPTCQSRRFSRFKAMEGAK